MTPKTANEFSVDVKDMFCSVLLKWRVILLAGILCAALYGGYELSKVRKSSSQASAPSDSYSAELQAYNANVAAFKKSIAGIRGLIVADNEYLENSVLMQIDPYAVAKSEGVLTLEMTGSTDTFELTKLANRYIDVLGNVDTLSRIAEENGMEQRYLAELETLGIEDIVVESGDAVTVVSLGNGAPEDSPASLPDGNTVVTGTTSAGSVVTGTSGTGNTDTGSASAETAGADSTGTETADAEGADAEALQIESGNDAGQSVSTVTLRLVIIGVTTEQTEKIYADAMRELESAGEAIRAEIPHTASYGEPVTRVRIDTAIMDKQAAKYYANTTYNTNLQKALDQSRVIEKPSSGGSSSKKRVSKKKVAAAGAAGILAMFVLLLLLYLLDPCVKSEDDIAQQYGIKKAGAFARTVRKGPFAALDRRILRRVGGAREVSGDETAAMIGVNIENFAGSAKSILVTGMAEEARLRAISEKVTEWLANENADIELVAEPNLLDRTEARKALAACDAVVLLESRGKTRHSEVREELRLIADMGREVVGYVMT